MTRLMSPRAWLFIALAVAALVQTWLIQRDGWNPTWRRWQIDARTPHFSDLRAILGAADSIDQGFDPREKNPGAPFGQRFNQTSVWLRLRDVGIREADSGAIGLLLLAGYGVSLWWLCAGIDRRTAVILAPLILSPACLLAVERGTTDLSVCFLLALAAHIAARRLQLAVPVVLVAFVLKLFPLAGLALVLRESRARALRLALPALAVAVLFCAYNFRELIDIGYKTEKGPHTSYGWAVLSLHLGTLHGAPRNFSSVAAWGGAALALLGTLAALICGMRSRQEPTAENRSLDFFRVGCAVYAGTFALGASWDYRLIFALFMVPQLSRWTSDTQRSTRIWSCVMLVALLIAAWSLALKPSLGNSTAAHIVGRGLEESAKWGLFFGCTYLFTRSLPPWIPRIFSAPAATAPREAT